MARSPHGKLEPEGVALFPRDRLPVPIADVPVEVPDRLYFRIGEVSTITGIPPYVLRYWETEFRSIRPQKSRKGQRIYSRRDVEKLITVKDLLYSHGFTIAGARKKLREGGAEPPARSSRGRAIGSTTTTAASSPTR